MSSSSPRLSNNLPDNPLKTSEFPSWWMFQLRSGRNNPNLHFIWSPSSPSQPVSESASIKATLQSNLLAFYISDPTVLIHYTYIHVFDDVALDYTVPPFFSIIISGIGCLVMSFCSVLIKKFSNVSIFFILTTRFAMMFLISLPIVLCRYECYEYQL